MNRVLRNGRLSDGSTVDIHLDDDGLITEVSAAGSRPAAEGEGQDLGRWLVLPALAEPHAHLDKALSAEMVPNPKGDLGGGDSPQSQS